jgi:integrase
MSTSELIQKPTEVQAATARRPGTVKEVRQVKVRGVKRWQARVQYQGRRASCLCDSRDAAKLAKADLLAKLKADAEQETKAEAAPATFTLACAGYLLDLEARGKGRDTISTARNATERLLDFLGARRNEPVETLTAADLYAYWKQRAQRWARCGKKTENGTRIPLPGGAKASTINRDLRTIRAMLKRILPNIKFPADVFFDETPTRVRWLRPEQEVLTFDAVPAAVHVGPKRGTRPAPFRDMAQLAALTLMRLSEVRLLRRDQVDLWQGIVTLPQMKGEPRQVILNAEARSILTRILTAHESPWVFPAPSGRPYSRHTVSRRWRTAADATGLADFHFHDLRHHGATMALHAGHTAPIVMALGGWKTEKMMRRYAAVTDKTLRAAAEAVSGNVSASSGNAQWQRNANPAIMHAPL